MSSRPFARQLSVWADFNALDGEGRITASLRFSDTPARPFKGEWVRLYDDEGNAVMGIVEQIHDLTVHVRPEMATWTSAEISVNEPFGTQAVFRAGPQGRPIQTTCVAQPPI